MAVKGATPANLDCVAEFILVTRFGQNAVIELFAALRRPPQQFWRAVDCDSFFVTGDQERDRAFRLSATLAKMIEHRCDRTGDAALHVDGATAVKFAARNLARKWRMLPRVLVARRDDIGM